MKRSEVAAAQARAREMPAAAGVALSEAEAATIEVADLGLNRLAQEGLELVTCFNNDRYCPRELVLFPGQTCPEHRHPPVNGEPGKQETFRCRRGLVWLHVEGPPSANIRAQIPGDSRPWYTVFHQMVLQPGQQYTIPPDTLHWFQAGPEGAVVSEFSSRSRDEFDIFTNPGSTRAPAIQD